MRTRGLVAIGLASFLLAPLLVTGTATPVTAASSLVPSVPAVRLCGVTDLREVTAADEDTPSPPPTEIASNLAPSGLFLSAGKLYVLEQSRSRITVLNAATGAVTAVLPLSWSQAWGPVVDPDGNVYLTKYPYTLVKLDPAGHQLWARTSAKALGAVFSQVTPRGWRVGAVTGDGGQTILFGADGTQHTAPNVRGKTFSRSGNSLVSTDGRYVRVYDGDFELAAEFGAATKDNDPMPAGAPFHFYQQGSAVRLGDGKLLVADGRNGVAVTSPEGFLRGFASQQALGLTAFSPMVTDGTTVWYVSGVSFAANSSISMVPVAQVLDMAGRRGQSVTSRLGYGAGIQVNAKAGKYFSTAEVPRVRATFDPWWARIPGLTLEYAVRDRSQVVGNVDVPMTRRAIDAAAVANGVDLQLPSTRPDFYEVEAFLLRNGTRLSGTCASYGIAAPGQHLDLDALPGSHDAGGPDPVRGLALAEALGTGLHRETLDWRFLLPSDPAAPLDFSRYDASIAAGATASAARGVPFVVQVGSGGPEKGLIYTGQWERRVAELVRHYRDLVDFWEVWNEPNNTVGFALNYVDFVLEPFSRAVRAHDPSAKIVGGDPVGVAVQYWDDIGWAGGFPMMDIIGLHPYTGHNRSFEEEGLDRSMGKLRDVLVKYGAQDKPVWVTEHAWWSDGPANFFAQADFSARAQLWYRKWGVDRWAYFISQGTWGNNGISFSAIQGGDYVKPAAAALMTVKRQVQARPYLGEIETGIPHVYVQRYGPSAAEQDGVLAVWTDDLATGAVLRQPVGATSPLSVEAVDLMGARSTIMLPESGGVLLDLDGSPRFLHTPAGRSVQIAPVETWGGNLAARSAGGSVTASSSGGWNPASAAIDGISDARGQGDFRSSPAWASAPGDTAPTLTVTLPRQTSVNRLILSSVHLGSTLTGVAAFSVDARKPDGTWVEVASRDGLFHGRTTSVTFPATSTDALRVRVRGVNFSGYAGGMMPAFWPVDEASLTDPTQPYYGPAIVREVEIYAPGDRAAISSPSTTTGAPTTTTRPPGSVSPPPPKTGGRQTASRPKPSAGVVKLSSSRPGALRTVRVNSTLKRAFRVRAVGADGQPRRGVGVKFAVKARSTNFRFATTSVLVRTNSKGWATAPEARAGSRPGRAVVVASTPRASRILFPVAVYREAKRSRSPIRLIREPEASSTATAWSAVRIRPAHGLPPKATHAVLRVDLSGEPRGRLSIASRRSGRGGQDVSVGARTSTTVLIIAKLDGRGRVWTRLSRGAGMRAVVRVQGWLTSR